MKVAPWSVCTKLFSLHFGIPFPPPLPPPRQLSQFTTSLDTRQILIEPRLKDLAGAGCVTEADVSSFLTFHFPNDMAGSLSPL